MFNKKLFVFALSIALAGCSSVNLESPKDKYQEAFVVPEKASQMLQEKESCCLDYSQFTYQNIENDDTFFVPVTDTSQVFQFESGKSFFQAYKLDFPSNEVDLEISAIISNTVINPQIILLDGNFNVTRTISADAFKYNEASLLNGNQLTTEIKIKRPKSGSLENETYLIFYTTDAAILGSTTIIHPAKQFAKAHSTVPPAIDDPIIPHSSVGVIKVTFDVIDVEEIGEASYQPEYIKEGKGTTPSEADYNKLIIKAVNANEIDKALGFVDQSEAAGFKSARPTFVDALKK